MNNEFTLNCAAFRPGLLETRGDDDDRTYAYCGTLIDGGGDESSGDDHHSEIDAFRDLADRRLAPMSVDIIGFGIDRVHGSREATVDQIREYVVSNLGVVTCGTDHGDRLR